MRTIYLLFFLSVTIASCMAQTSPGVPVGIPARHDGTLRFYFSPDSLKNTAHGSEIDSLNNLANDDATGNLSFTFVKGTGSDPQEAQVSHGSLSGKVGITMEGDEALSSNQTNWGWIHNGSSTKFTAAFVFKVVKSEDDASTIFDSRNSSGVNNGCVFLLENRDSQVKGSYSLQLRAPNIAFTLNPVDIGGDIWTIGEVSWFILTYENGIAGDDAKLFSRSGTLLGSEETGTVPTGTGASNNLPTWGQKSVNSDLATDWSTLGDFIWYEKALSQTEIDSLVEFWATKYDTLNITYAKHYQNVDEGTAGGDAGSWATAIDTWTNFDTYMDGVINHGDTVLVHGDNGTVSLVPPGILSRDGIIIMDSTLHAIGGVNTFIANMDSTKLWSTEFKMMSGFSGDFAEVYGINFDLEGGGTSHTSTIIKNDVTMKLNKFSNPATSHFQVIQLGSDRFTFEYNLIVDDSPTFLFATIGVFDPGTGADSYKFNHNTIYNKTDGLVRIMFSLTDPIDNTPDSIIVRNNIFIQGNTGGNSIMVDHVEPDENWNDSDYNSWFRLDPDLWTDGSGFKWDGEGAPYQPFQAWRDSLQSGEKGIDPDGESHSIETDPLVSQGSDYGLLLPGSPARGTASDGTNMGFWQDGSGVSLFLRRHRLLRAVSKGR